MWYSIVRNTQLESRPDCRLIITGSGSIEDYLNICSDIFTKVSFSGYIEHDQMIKFYRIADIGIIPSIYDHCPYVALEMMKYGLPIIISDSEGLNEILSDRKNCIYVPQIIDEEGNRKIDTDKLTTSMLSLLNNNKFAKTIRNNAKKTIMKNHRTKNMIYETYKVYKNAFI